MAVWYDTLPIKDLFDDDDSDANVGRIAMIVHDRLTKARPRIATELPRKLRHPADMDEYDSIVDEFHSIGVMNEGGKVDWFDNLLASLYDWADDHRVWIGP